MIITPPGFTLDLQATPDENQIFHIQQSCHACAGLATDEPGLHLSHLALTLFRKILEQIFADHHPQHRISKKLEPFVRIKPGLRRRAVRKATAQQHPITELIADPRFTSTQRVVN